MRHDAFRTIDLGIELDDPLRSSFDSLERFRTCAFGHDAMRVAISLSYVTRQVDASDWFRSVPTCYRKDVARCAAEIVGKYRGRLLDDELVLAIVADLHREIWRSVDPVDPSTPLEF